MPHPFLDLRFFCFDGCTIKQSRQLDPNLSQKLKGTDKVIGFPNEIGPVGTISLRVSIGQSKPQSFVGRLRQPNCDLSDFCALFAYARQYVFWHFMFNPTRLLRASNFRATQALW